MVSEDAKEVHIKMCIDRLTKLTGNYPQIKEIESSIIVAFEMIKESYQKSGKLLLCGNGGSASDCEHIVGELMKGFLLKRKLSETAALLLKKCGADTNMLNNLEEALPAVSLVAHTSFISAWCNDNDADYMFAQQVYALGNAGDILWAISTSGNSVNVINAAITARAKGIKVIGMTGRKGGKLQEYADAMIRVPSDETARIQELHIPIYHEICAMLENYFFGSDETDEVENI